MFQKAVTHTTRKPRQGEVDGVHYHFTDPETMKREIAEGKFVESAIVSAPVDVRAGMECYLVPFQLLEIAPSLLLSCSLDCACVCRCTRTCTV